MGTSIKLHNKTIDKTSSILSPDNQTEDLEIKLPNKNGTLATTEDLGSAVNEEKVTEIINKVVMGEPTTGEGSESGGTTENKNYKVYYKGERLVRALREDKIITVGAKGDCKSLGEALEEASYWHSVYNPTLDWSIIPKTVTGIKNPQAYNRRDGKSPMLYIKILSGTKLNEQINIVGQNLGHVIVMSEDAEVPVTNAAFTYTPLASDKAAEDPNFQHDPLNYYVYRQGSYMQCFIRVESSVAPLFNCKFVNDKKYVLKTTNNINHADFTGIGECYNVFNSFITIGSYGGCSNFERGIYAENSRVHIAGAKWENSRSGVHVDNSTTYYVGNTTYNNCIACFQSETTTMGELNVAAMNRGEAQDVYGKAYTYATPNPGVMWINGITATGYKSTDVVTLPTSYKRGLNYVSNI